MSGFRPMDSRAHRRREPASGEGELIRALEGWLKDDGYVDPGRVLAQVADTVAREPQHARPRWAARPSGVLDDAVRLLLAAAVGLVILVVASGLLVPTIVGPAAPSSPSVSPTPSTLAPTGSAPGLVVGDPAPPWSGALLDGRPFSITDLRGRPAALFLWCLCATGSGVEAFIGEARARADEMTFVLVSLSDEGTTRGLVDWLNVTTPVVYDPAWSLPGAWGQSFPELVLLAADGTVADVRPGGRFNGDELGVVLDALLAGGPPPAAWPVPTPAFEGWPPVSYLLQVGTTAPEIHGPRLGGGELSSRDLLGKPTVVLSFLPGSRGDGPGPEPLLADLAPRAGDLNVLLLAQGEAEPGMVAALIDGLDYVPEVMFDWDGAQFDRWGLVYWPTLILLDADGRVAGYYGRDVVANPKPLLDAFQSGRPLPSPPASGP